MQLDQPLQVVTPTVDGAVLAALARAEGPFTGRGLHQLIGRYSAEGVRRALDRLTAQGIVDVAVAGPSKLYHLNREHLAAPYIAGLAGMQEELIGRLRRRFAEWAVAPAYAALFGSAAGGQMRPDSDIDVLVIRPGTVEPDSATWNDQVQQLEEDASKWTGNDLRVLEMSEADVTMRRMNTDQIIADVRDEGVRLAGPAAYLTRRPAKRGRRG